MNSNISVDEIYPVMPVNFLSIGTINSTGRRTRVVISALVSSFFDFAGGELDGLDRSQPVKAFVSANGGQVDTVTVESILKAGCRSSPTSII